MAVKQFGVDIDLDLNQLLNVIAENLAIAPGAATQGRYWWNTALQRLQYDTGSVIQDVANLNDVAGLLDFKGGYDVATDTPAIAGGVGVLKGDYYVVTTGGSFLGVQLEIGDSLFANVNGASIIADWTIVQGNIIPATETIAGVVKLSTQALADAGVDDTTAMTPLKVKNLSYNAKKFTSPSTSVGLATPVTFTHNLNNVAPVVTIKRVSTGALVTLAVNNFTANTFDVVKNGASYNVVVTAQG
jgi:hypothetical protein